MFPFAYRALKNVFAVGFNTPYRGLFWKFFREAVSLRLRGKIPSILDVLFKVTPTAYHLIEWNRTYLEEAAQAVPPKRELLPASVDKPPPAQLVQLKAPEQIRRAN